MSNPSLDEILRTIPGRSLVQLAESDKNLANAVEDARTTKKGGAVLSSNAARKIILNEIRRISGKILAETMSTKQRADAVAKLNIDHKEQGNNPKSTRVHKKRLLEAVEGGVLDFLKENVDAEGLVEIGEAFELELSEKTGVDKLASQLTNQIEYEAVSAFLESFPNDLLLDVAFDMKLSEASATAATGTVVEAILTNTDVKELKKPAPKKKSVKVSKTKPKIAKGVTYDDLFQWYTVDEIRDFAKDNELLVSGSKKDLIKRILAWFEGDKENTTKEGLEKKKAAKKEANAKKAAKKEAKKKASKKSGDEEEKPKKETKSKAKAEPAKEEPAAEVDLDLDLDNLEQYNVDTLKKYCLEEKIAVTGKGKNAYITAINKYNDEGETAEGQ
jgi:hypothetical protein